MTEQEMMQDLQAADAAGDTKLAQHIADRIKAQRAGAPAPSVPRSQLEAIEPGITQAKARTELQNKELGPTSGMNPVSKFFVGNTAGVADTVLAARQLAASAGLGDKEALAKEAARKKKEDAELDTGAGAVGKFVGNLVPQALAANAITRGAAPLVPAAVRAFAPTATRVAGSIGNAATQGATSGVLTPEEKYAPGTQAGAGAIGGVVGDVAMRGAGGLLNPAQFFGVNAARQRAAEAIDQISGMPRLIAENISNSGFIRSLSNALAQMGPAGAGVSNARNANKGYYTGRTADLAGMPTGTTNITSQVARDAQDSVAARGDAFRGGPDVPIDQITPPLRAILENIGPTASITGARGPATLTRAIDAATPRHNIGEVGGTPPISNTIAQVAEQQPANVARDVQGPGSGIFDTIEQAKAGTPNQHVNVDAPLPTAPPARPTLTAEQAIRARSIASKQSRAANLQGPEGVLQGDAARALRDELEAAITATHPDQGAAFRAWKQQHGALKDIEAAGTKEGHILPEDFLTTMDPKVRLAPRTPHERLTVAAADRAATPSLAENRSLMTRMLMGGIPGVGATAGFFGADNGLTGAAAGAAGTLALAHWLLGTPGGGRYITGQNRSAIGRGLQSRELKDLLQQLGALEGGSVGADFATR